MEKNSYERRIYESVDDKNLFFLRDFIHKKNKNFKIKGAYLRLYLKNRRKIKFMKQRVK